MKTICSLAAITLTCFGSVGCKKKDAKTDSGSGSAAAGTGSAKAGGGGGTMAGGGSAAAGGGGALHDNGGGKCPDGVTYVSKSNFCIKLPKGGKGTREGISGLKGKDDGDGRWEFSFLGGDKGWDFSIQVMVHAMKPDTWDWNKEHVGDPPYQGKKTADGKIGDTGMWASGEDGPPPSGYAQRHWVKGINKTDKNYLVCKITRANGKEEPKEEEVFEACKTIAFAKS
jgi:hypothetical protein